MKIAVIGGGYVGLVSGACFAEFGVEVAVVETDRTKLAMLRQGHMPIFELGLDRHVEDNVNAGRLSFGDDLAAAVTGADIVFIAAVTATATSRLPSSGPWNSWNLRHERCLYCYRSPRKFRLTGTTPWSSRD